MKALYLSTLFFIGLFKITYSQSPYPFMADVVSQYPGVRDVAISSDGSEIYFSLQGFQGELSTIILVTHKNGAYSKAQVAGFSGKYHDLEPFLSNDGLRLYFSSDRPLNENSNELKDYDIWYVERESIESQWSKPINVGVPINTKNNEFYPSITLSNNLYFTSDGAKSKGKDDIFMSEYDNGKYKSPESLGDSINSIGYEFNAYVSPDESFMLYTCYNREGGAGSGDLYISFTNRKGQWLKSKNIGKAINSSAMDYCPFVDLKMGVLYFTSKRNSVKNDFDKKQGIDEVLKGMNIYENGLSRLYQVDISNILKNKVAY
jgi:hypothetical protein